MKKNKTFVLVSLTMFSLFLSGCSDLPIDKESFLSRISFNLWDFVITFAAFVVLVLIAFFFGYKPVKKFIQKRKDYINGNIKEAEKREEESRNLVSEANENISKSKKEAMEIVSKAREDALKQKETILLSAKKEAQEEKVKAREEIEQEIKANQDDIHHEIVNVAMDASSKILGREVNKEDNKRLVNDFIKELNDEDK